jgi:hypothetical protein
MRLTAYMYGDKKAVFGSSASFNSNSHKAFESLLKKT